MQYQVTIRKRLTNRLKSVFPCHALCVINLLFFLAICPAQIFAQNIDYSSYQELPDPNGYDISQWQRLDRPSKFTFGSATTRYEKHQVPSIGSTEAKWRASGWKGEKIHTQLLIYSKIPLSQVSILSNELKNKNGNFISSKNIVTNFVRYVMVNGLNTDGTGCELPVKMDSSLREDVLDNIGHINVPENTVQPVWLTIAIPENTIPGLYYGTIFLQADNRKAISRLNYTLKVLNHTLPIPASWKFHLDLWQNPYAIARVSKTQLWSAEHFDAMKSYIQLLASAGQKTITTTIIDDPWNSQTYDKYGSMVRWIKRNDGTWTYDYTIFDKWVAFMISLGIDQQINCYSMIPWNLKFSYYDELKGKDTVLIAKPGTDEYTSHWKPMLSDFDKHLRAKGWFDKTCIAMDERPLEDMQMAIAVIRGVDKDFKIALAGRYHPEIEKDIYDYCVASNQVIDQKILGKRQAETVNSTFYTACTEGAPNTFTFSPPSDATWLAWFAMNKNFNGYLRWAYNCWNKDPLLDSRFGKWSSGDAFLVYPGCRSSIRFESLIGGIQDFEKIRILKNEYIRKKQYKKLLELNAIISQFTIENLTKFSTQEMIKMGEQKLNSVD